MAKDRLLDNPAFCDHIEEASAEEAKMVRLKRQQENRARWL